MPTLVDEQPPLTYFADHIAHPKLSKFKRRSMKGYITTRISQSVLTVFESLGSWEGMLAWAKDNPDAFYGVVVPKLLPVEIAARGIGQGITVIIQRNEKPVETDPPACKQIVQAEAQADENETSVAALPASSERSQ